MGNMWFELLLAWASGLNQFPCSFLTSLANHVKRGIVLIAATQIKIWSNVDRMGGLVTSSMPSPFSHLPGIWQNGTYGGYTESSNGPFKFLLSPSACRLFWVQSAVPIITQTGITFSWILSCNNSLSFSVKCSSRFLSQNATPFEVLLDFFKISTLEK